MKSLKRQAGSDDIRSNVRVGIWLKIMGSSWNYNLQVSGKLYSFVDHALMGIWKGKHSQ